MDDTLEFDLDGDLQQETVSEETAEMRGPQPAESDEILLPAPPSRRVNFEEWAQKRRAQW